MVSIDFYSIILNIKWDLSNFVVNHNSLKKIGGL